MSSDDTTDGRPKLGQEPIQPKGADLSFLNPRNRTAAADRQAPADAAETPPAANDGPPPASPRSQDDHVQSDDHVQGRAEDGSDGQAAKPVIVYIPSRLRTKLKKAAAGSGRTYTDVLFDAVDALDAHLPDLFKGHPAAPSPGSLFSRRSVRGRPTSTRPAPNVQVPIRPPTIADLQVLDDRANRYTAGNRSEFVRVVLSAYLSGKTP
ncbi:hypothetical protein SAMN04489712_1622 [Thermomonospora echinospora]|uniref:Ribbon-helix-helix protein, copG family n=1 Tax=Thermomonospora echinospora TaxID=1992 RepID=A0A1H6EBB6_9ACTN|nr:hypothetical protein [Thermomonospora echinospora]SEG95047.1 hypothetical protein SAMN04489712_1622 [Thermomonospora echinospora]